MEITRKRTAPSANSLGGLARLAQATGMVAEAARSNNPREVRHLVKKYGLLAVASPKRAGYTRLTSGLALTIVKLQRQVESFRGLPANWDSYGAFPTTEAAIRQTGLVLNSLLLQLGRAEGISLHVFPMRDGGVQVDLDREGSSLEIEVHPDATQSHLLFTAEGDLFSSPVSLSAALRKFTTQPRVVA